MASEATDQVEQVEQVEEAEEAEQEQVALAPVGSPQGISVIPSQSEMAVMRTLVSALRPLVGTDFLPKQINTPHKALAVVLKGRELGVPPMEALAQLYVVNGKVTMQAQLMLALIARSGRGTWQVEESTAERCTVTMTRSDNGSKMSLTWTMAEAEAAKLTTQWDNKAKKLVPKAVWQKFPAAMLRARAISACARVVFPDVIGGLYTPEELDVPVVVSADGEIEVDVEVVALDEEPIDADWEDEPTPEPEGAEDLPQRACPKCGKPLALRDGKRGPFWSCTGWRRDGTGCDHTEDAKPDEAEAGAEDIPEGFGDEDDGSEWEGEVQAERLADRRVRLEDGTWLLISEHALERARERLSWEPEETRREAQAAAERFVVGDRDRQGRTIHGNAIFAFAAVGQNSIALQTVVEGGRQGEVPLSELARQVPEPEPTPAPAPDDEPEEDDPIGAREAVAMAAELAEIEAEGCPHTLATYKTMLRERGVTTGDEAQELFTWACKQVWGERATAYRPDGLSEAEWQQIWPRIVGLLEATKGEEAAP